MKGPPNLEDRTALLLEQLTAGLDDDHGRGWMSPAIYDTAWLAMVWKPINGGAWLFPQCFQYVLDQQQVDGSWPSYASAIDGILNTAASLLCLQRHCASLLPSCSVSHDEISTRIDRATLALQNLLDVWDVASTVHVGFEVLVPALLEYIRLEGVSFTFPGIETLKRINEEKLKKFKPEYLYGKLQLTALHSLEAFIGKVDFDKVSHHKVKGSFMASPSSTTAYLMNASTWDNECEDYLRQVVDHGPGAGSGGVPSAWPSTTFETTWVVSTLLDAGVDVASILPQGSVQVIDYLHRAIESGNGVTGFASGLGADADDTAKSILILNLLGKPTSPAGLVKQFEDEDCFKTYPLERDPSFSANVNCLIALLHAPDPSLWTSQILKIINFLCSRYEQSGVELQDKWNISPYYSMMLLAQALSKALRMAKDARTPALADPQIVQRMTKVLTGIFEATVQGCNDNGSWGQRGLREETAYAAIALAAVLSANVLPDLAIEAQQTLEKSRRFLANASSGDIQYLWVEKVTFGSPLLSETYVLAALELISKVNANTTDRTIPQQSLLNGTSNGVATHAMSERVVNASENVDSDDTMPTSSVATNRVHLNGASKTQHARTDSVMDHSSQALPNGSQTPQSGDCRSWTQGNEKILCGPYDYLDKNPGKDIRGAFISAFNTWLRVPPERLTIINKIVRMLHTSSLLVDDIEDNSDLRRGIPVAHSIFGIPQTFNSANYVYFQALKEVRDMRNPEALDAFVDELLNLHRGQGLDLYWRDSLTCPTEKEYLDMVGNKTGGLFRLAIRLMQAESTTGRDLLPLVSLLGLQFQVCDDYLNLKSLTYTTNKGYCEDLTEGKFSFPVIHSIHADPTNKELLNILKQKPHEAEIKKYAVDYMETTGSFEYTRTKVAELKARVLDLIDEYEGNGWGDASAIRKLVSRLDIS